MARELVPQRWCCQFIDSGDVAKSMKSAVYRAKLAHFNADEPVGVSELGHVEDFRVFVEYDYQKGQYSFWRVAY